MAEDMSDIIQKMNDMLKNNEIPDNIKNIMSQLGANTSNASSDGMSSENNTQSSYSNEQNTSSSNTDLPNFDIGMMLKMKSIIDSMNSNQNDPRANLLKSLKPYLKPSRKEKVEQYIKLFSMGKVFEMLNPLDGDKKNDV